MFWFLAGLSVLIALSIFMDGPILHKDLRDKVLDEITKRPVSRDDLSVLLNEKRDDLEWSISTLERDGRISTHRSDLYDDIDTRLYFLPGLIQPHAGRWWFRDGGGLYRSPHDTKEGCAEALCKFYKGWLPRITTSEVRN
jgi:hypothetical protein